MTSLAARPRPASVLVVCHANLFRSAFAAAVLRRALGPLPLRVESAGFVGAGRPAPRESVAAAAGRAVDLANHRSQLLTAGLARAAGLVVVMDAAQHRMVCERFGRSPRDVILLGDFDPQAITSRAIEDPADADPDLRDRVYDRIERCAMRLAAALAGMR